MGYVCQDQSGHFALRLGSPSNNHLLLFACSCISDKILSHLYTCKSCHNCTSSGRSMEYGSSIMVLDKLVTTCMHSLNEVHLEFLLQSSSIVQFLVLAATHGAGCRLAGLRFVCW